MGSLSEQSVSIFQYPENEATYKNFSLDDPSDFKLAQKKDTDKINHIGKFGKNLNF